MGRGNLDTEGRPYFFSALASSLAASRFFTVRDRYSTFVLLADMLIDGRQLVGNTLVAVDTGLAFGKCLRVHASGTITLLGVVHVVVTVAVAALLRVVRLHALPFVLGQLAALGIELLGRIDGAQDLVQTSLEAWILRIIFGPHSLGT
jgi:hypothetical protein